MSTPESNAARALIWRTRDSTRHLLHAFTVSFAIALTTGALLFTRIGHGNLVQVLLLAHLAAGALSLFFFVPFVVIHWRDGREPLLHLVFPFRLVAEWRRDPCARHRLIGHALLWLTMLVLLSGLVVILPAFAFLGGHPATLPLGTHRWLLDLHAWATPALIAIFFLHFPLKKRP